jgi:hypothetical protein
MPTDKALTLSAKDIAKAVDAAVKLAAEKHKVQINTEFRIGPGTIMGRLLAQANVNLQQAEQIAAEITNHVQQQHATAASAAALTVPQLQPAVLIRNRLILCGFFPTPQPELELL